MEIIKTYETNGKFEVNLMRWNEDDISPKLGELITDRDVIDIRIWKDDVPATGVCLLDDMIIAFLFHCTTIADKVGTVYKSGMHRNVNFYIYERVATLRKVFDKELVFTRCSFKEMSDRPGYDLRYWNKDMTMFTKGIHMNSEERFIVGKALTDYLDDKKITFPNWNLCDQVSRLSVQDLVANLTVMLDRSILLGSPDKINLIAGRIIDIILAE